MRARRFAIRTQRRNASSAKPARISLVSQRSIVVGGSVVRAGQAVDLSKKVPLRSIVSLPKRRQIRGEKLVAQLRRKNLKAGKINGG